jgi:hypothetical protein
MGKGEVALENDPALGHEEGVERRRSHTSAERAEPRQGLGLWASDVMQRRPGAVENEVGVVPR